MVEGPGEKTKRRRRLLRNVAIGCGISGVIIVVSCTIILHVVILPAFDGLGDIFDSPMCDPSNPQGIQDVARITLPPSYANLWSTCGGLQGWWAEARFDIVPRELQMFLDSTNVKKVDYLLAPPDRIYSSQLSELDPLSSFMYGLSDEPEWLQEVIVNTSNPDRWTVHFTLLAG